MVFAAHRNFNELARIGKVLHGAECNVAFRVALLEVLGHDSAGDADLTGVDAAKLRAAHECNVRLLEELETGPQCQIELFPALAIALMTLATVLIQDRLDEALVTYTPGAPGWRGQVDRVTLQCNPGAVVEGCGAVHFMAAHAASMLARHYAGKRTHRLQGPVVLIQDLEVQGLASRGFEVNGTVLFDGHSAENPFDTIILYQRNGRT